jgi:hypothetical protein
MKTAELTTILNNIPTNDREVTLHLWNHQNRINNAVLVLKKIQLIPRDDIKYQQEVLVQRGVIQDIAEEYIKFCNANGREPDERWAKWY